MKSKFSLKTLAMLLVQSIAFFGWNNVSAQTKVVEVISLTNKILVVHFNEGTINYHKAGQAQFGTDVVVYENAALNVTTATTLGTYSLRSSNDVNYNTAKNPTLINRKTKPTNIAIKDVADVPNHTNEHWLYLTLPTALQSGKNYTLNIGGNVATLPSFSFVFDEKIIPSEAIHVNNLGYVPASTAKFAYLYHWAGDAGSTDLTSFNGQPFQLINTSTNAVAFTGTITFRKLKTNQESTFSGSFVGETPNDNWLGADVWDCDFSAFQGTGTFKVVVPGMGCSFPFAMNNDVYRTSLFNTMKGLLQNRSGINLTVANGAERDRPAPHNVNITPGFAGRLKYASNANADGCSVNNTILGNINTFGWYQDAGDWDAYPNHSLVPLYLMFLYEANPKNFADSELGNPESGNQIPDLVDEGAWLIRFYQRTRKAIKDAGYGTGGVGGARVAGDNCQTGDLEGNIGRPSWQDVNRDWIVSGEDATLTFLYAGMASQLAFVLQSLGKTDPNGINWQQEAIESYVWASAKTVPNTASRMYAAASLYRLTGDEKYHNQFKSDFNANIKSSTNLAVEGDAFTANRWALWMYVLAEGFRPVDATILTSAKAKIYAAADFMTSSADKRACRWAGDFGFPMVVGQGTTPKIEDVVYAVVAAQKSNDAVKATNYRKYLYTTADYFLGTNPLKNTWITGVGPKGPNQLFHFDSWYSGTGSIKKGYIPYGPWSRFNTFPTFSAFSSDWPYQWVYPTDIAQWPGHERWFDQRSSPLGSEFTVYQTNAQAVVTYGFLCESKYTNAVPVTSISVSPKTLNFTTVGQTQSITATISPANATNKGVFWSSRNTDIATVDASGNVTAFVQGTTYIIARTFDGNKLDSCLINSNLPFVAVSSVSISAPSTSVVKLNFLQLTATVLPANATNKKVNWISSNTALATVDAQGNVKGISAGAVVITGTTQDGNKTATYNVTVLDPADYIIADYETRIPTINIIEAGKVQQFSPNGGSSSILANPVSSAANNSPNVTQYNKPASNYSLIGYLLPTELNIADGYRRFEFQLYGANITQVYVQVNDAVGLIKEQLIDVTFNNQWQTISLDLPTTGSVKQVGIFPNPNAAVAAPFYIDNVRITASGGTTVDTQAPTVPSALSVSTVTATSFTLNWTASTDNVAVASYDVFRDGVLVGNTATTSLSITGLTQGTNYSMTVKAKDAAGNVSAASTPLGVVTSDTQAPSIPGGLSSSAITATTFTLSWTAATDNIGVASYDVFRGGVLIGNSTTTSFAVTGLIASTAYAMTVKAKDAAGNISVASTVLNVTTLASSGGTGTGLTGTYFNNKTLTPPSVLTRTEAVNFDWGTGSPATIVNADNFSARWEGQVEAPVTGNYTFSTLSDDGVRLFVNGVLIINNFTDHGATTNTSANVALTAGTKYNIKLEYYENAGGAVIKLQWTYPGQALQIIPATRLYQLSANAGTGLSATYFNNKTLTVPSVLSRAEAVNFNWGAGSPATIVNADNFSARWEGKVEAPVTGVYTFSTVSDDGVRLSVNGIQIINNFTDHGATTDVGTQTLSFTAGQKYNILMEYYESGGQATAVLQWAYTGQVTQAIPIARLYPLGTAARIANDNLKIEEEISENSFLKLYPNPAKEIVNVEYFSAIKQTVSIKLIDILGQEIQSMEHQSLEGINRVSMPLSAKSGIYFISVKQDNGREIRKLVVE